MSIPPAYHYRKTSEEYGSFVAEGLSFSTSPSATFLQASAAGLHMQTGTPAPQRFNELLPSNPNAPFRLAVIEFNVPGAKNGGSDKGPNGHRIDSIPIANGVVKEDYSRYSITSGRGCSPNPLMDDLPSAAAFR